MTHIYYSIIDEHIHPYLMECYLFHFSENFENRIKRYKRWQDAQLSLLGRLLLKHGLKEHKKLYSKDSLVFNSYSKPYLSDKSLEFNISHSGNIVVCAINETCEIGIDIEEVSDIEIEDFRSHMTSNEWNRISNSKSTRNAFLDFWTQKEAVVKANGKGLSLSLDSFEVVDNYTVIHDDIYRTKEVLIDPDYKCHIAFKNSQDPTILSSQKICF